MTRCRICSYEMPEATRFCGGCGAPAGGNASASTVAVAPATTPLPGQGQFAAGALIAGRYRILDLVGRGGMGEVYRARDGKLDQVVALKFLPQALRQNVAALIRLHGEVRIARQVSHPNVCRVYDVGEADGLHFLTMEFIDGEDLNHLLRRIGRFPHDKGIEIARKICAALSAAHDRGVLHRDLKPANIMLNAAGQVRVTDFGLAVVAEQLRGDDAGSGTPAYMAPEQLERREVTKRSDIYSLGAVLYEIFTGKRAFGGRSRADLQNPSSFAKDVDPAVERVILQCLATDPRDRPETPQAVARALPGGDPIAAALAAGETPTPEMVAAAGAEAGISVRAAVLCLAGVVACLLAWLWIGDRLHISGNTSLDLPPEALAVKAREVAGSLGYKDRPADRAFGLAYDTEYVQHLRSSADRRPLRERRPTPVYFWYRESPAPLAPTGIGGVRLHDPPATLPGMLAVHLDSTGRLMKFRAVPPARGPATTPGETDWKALFDAAGLDLQGFEETRPEWAPPMFSDSRRAWRGNYPGQTDPPLRVEAGSLAGRPVYFRIIAPWTATAPGAEELEPARSVGAVKGPGAMPPSRVMAVWWWGITLLASWLAWHNLRSGRGDRRAAFRIGVYVFLVQLVQAAAMGDLAHALELPQREMFVVGASLYFAFLAWLTYIGLEPLVRRTLPRSLISWSRLFTGRLRDPLLGRDILAGVCAGCTAGVLIVGMFAAATSGNPIRVYGVELPTGIGWLAGVVTRTMGVPMVVGMAFVVLLSVLWALSGRRWAAVTATWVVWTGVLASVAAAPGVIPLAFTWAITGCVCALYLALFLRLGVTAMMVTMATVSLLGTLPRGLDFSAWHQDPGRAGAVLILALAAYGFHSALAGRRVFTGKALS